MSTVKPSHTEEEYFARVEVEKKKKLYEESREKLSQEEYQNLKQTHWMRCPKCGMELHSLPYKGVVIDKCFSCNGIFLDDGELEKIVGEEKSFLAGVLSLFRI